MPESKKETVRISEGLATSIEREFVETGLFLSKADFVSTAIRFYYENSIRQFGNDELKAVGDLAPRAIVQATLVNPEYLEEVNKYGGGKKRSILLRLPPEFVDRYQNFIDDTGFYRSKTDFFNNALGAYLVFQSKFGEMSNRFYMNGTGKSSCPYIGENSTPQIICASISPVSVRKDPKSGDE